MAGEIVKQVYVIFGPEELGKKEALDQLREAVGMPELVDANTTLLKAQGLSLQQLQDACGAMPFLAERRLIIVEGLLAQAEELQGQRTRGRGARSQKSRQEAWEDLPQMLGKLPPTTILVFLESAVPKTNPLLQSVAPLAEVREFQPPAGDALRNWIRARVANVGASISPAAVDMLGELVGGDLWALQGEIEKLALHAGEQGIEEQDVEALVSNSREVSIFRAVDAILAGQTGQALQLFEGLRQGGAEIGYIFTMIARQLRFVLVAQELQRGGVPRAEFGARLGAQDFAVRIVLEQARKYTAAQLEGMYRLLVETDWAIKKGEMSEMGEKKEQLALETLVAELAGTGGQGRRMGGRYG